MKKIILFILSFLIFILPVGAFDISSKNVILYNLDNGEILYEQNSNNKIMIASLTKLMTALVTLDNVSDLNKQVVLTNSDFNGLKEANVVTAGFKVGEVLTYKDLLYGLLLPSGADAAMGLARGVSGNLSSFIDLMNKKASELKLKNTHFSNVIGLDDDNNYSTVDDVSVVFKKCLENSEFKKIITAGSYTTTDGQVTFKSTIKKNAIKYNIDIPYVLGGKTGTTDGAGLCLASIAKANGVNYMLVTCGAVYDKKLPHHLLDAKEIYDYYIDNYANWKIVDKKVSFGEIRSRYTKEKTIKLYPSDDVFMYLPNNYDKKNIKYEFDGLKEVSSFTKKNEKLGVLRIYYKNKLINKQSVFLKKKLKFDLFCFIREQILYIILSLGLVVLIFYLKKIKRNKI